VRAPVPIATFSRCQADPIIVATGADDFTEPIATVIFIATKGNNSDDIILMFSPTSPTRTLAHKLLNTRQSMVFECLKHGLAGGRWYSYVHVRMCVNEHIACWCKEHPVENVLLIIFFMQSKRN
jgi:hypothetical protein